MPQDSAPALAGSAEPRERTPAPLAAAQVGTRLARRLEYLTWWERSDRIDAFLWEEAQLRLNGDEITAVVNRQAHVGSGYGPITDYATFCQAALTQALLDLAEPVRITGEGAALAHYVSLLPEHRQAAVEWIGNGHHADLGRHLARWPGHAFLLLALCPSDSAESFLARDAFFAAVLGRT